MLLSIQGLNPVCALDIVIPRTGNPANTGRTASFRRFKVVTDVTKNRR